MARSVVLLLALVFALVDGERTAAAAPATPTFDALVEGGWRIAIDTYDRASGFQAGGGGGSALVGVAFGWVGLCAGGRVRASQVIDGSLTLIEYGGDLALQLLVAERVRLRLGGEVGQGLTGGTSPLFAGGFASALFDVARFGGGRTALAFSLRLDLDAWLTSDTRLPALSPALAAGFGFRY